MDLPIEIRRQLLAEILKLANSPYLLMSETFTPGRPGVEAIWARGGEGAMIKRAGSLYRPGWRSPDWIKVKLWDYEAVELTGFEARKEGPHAVMLFRFRDGIESKCKTLGNKWLREFDANGQKYVGRWFIVKYQGRTDKERKPRHPQFDHFAAPEELK
jgi:ATP-dependent DNA ligase